MSESLSLLSGGGGGGGGGEVRVVGLLVYSSLQDYGRWNFHSRQLLILLRLVVS